MYVIRMAKSRRTLWIGHVARIGRMRNVYNILVGKTGGREYSKDLKRRWEGNIKI
jgi:hypothetical protein